jgi:Na+/melibiose symporter-like transporter
MWFRRAGVLLLILHAALPAWAHGESLIYVCGTVLYVAPAAILLFVPWHKAPVRLLVAALLVAGAVVLWHVVLPRIDVRRLSTLGEWSLMFSPTLCAYALAGFLRFADKAQP